MTKIVLALALVLIISPSPSAAEAGASHSIEALLAAIPGARALDTHDGGKLDSTGALFHAQLIKLGNDGAQQIIVLREQPRGEFHMVDQSKMMSAIGGSGNWRVNNIEISNASLYVTVAYTWHGCSGSARSQFRFESGRLVMIGNESSESNQKTGETVDSSSNLLTGKGYWELESGGRKKRFTAHERLAPIPFTAYDGIGWISPYHANRRIC